VKTCPFCAEQIPDDATRCPYCDSDLTATSQPVATSQPAPAGPQPMVGERVGPQPVVGQGAIAFSHSGTTYLLGWGPSFFGIWNRNVPGGASRTFARTDEGWREAWLEYTRMESNFVPVTPPSS
jgi:hypothetical protein